jgi:hypothetical protein
MYRGMSAGARLAARPANMSAAVMSDCFVTPSFSRTRTYGAGAIEAADERLAEEVKANRAHRKKVVAHGEGVKNFQRSKADQEAYDQTPEGIEEQIAEARRRRKWLEEEVEKAKLLELALMKKQKMALEKKKKAKDRESAKEAMERKLKAAFVRKLEESGGKPAGVSKSVPPKKAPASMQRKKEGVE